MRRILFDSPVIMNSASWKCDINVKANFRIVQSYGNASCTKLDIHKKIHRNYNITLNEHETDSYDMVQSKVEIATYDLSS
jgi:hypothetical protein